MVRTLQSISLIVISFIIIVLCCVHAAAVTANARITPVQGNAPLNVMFSDISEGSVIEWHWDFGDGFTGDGPKTLHTYMSPGKYSVKLLVKDAQGVSDTAHFNNAITVYSNPFMPSLPVSLPSFSADFTGEPLSGPSPLTVQFIDLSKGEPLEWLWDFGDETTSSEINPIHIYNKPGFYTVMLKISGDSSSGMKERHNYIRVTEGESTGPITNSPDHSVPINQQSVQEIPVKGTELDQTPYMANTNSEFDNICDSDLFLKSESNSVNSGKNLTITFNGSPFEKIFLWITGDTDEYFSDSKELPYFTDDEMMFDGAAGPYLIGSFIPDVKTGLTIRELIIENQSENSFKYYGMVALDKNGEHNVTYNTNNVSSGNYSINAITGEDSEKIRCVKRIHIRLLPASDNYKNEMKNHAD